MNNSVFGQPVGITLPGYASQQMPANEPSTDPAKGESIIYKIPPAFWIFFFLFVGYVGMRYVMED